MKKITILFFLLPILILGCKTETELGKEEMGEFAPPDAYEEGSKHPYYGSENEWNRRFFYDHIKGYYKRRGQRQMLDIVEGRFQDAVDYCQKLLENDPGDLESMFNLAVAQAVVYLAGPSGDFITGSVVNVDGGADVWGEYWALGKPDWFEVE